MELQLKHDLGLWTPSSPEVDKAYCTAPSTYRLHTDKVLFKVFGALTKDREVSATSFACGL